MRKINLSIFIILFLVFKTEAQTSVLNFADSLMQIGNYKNALKELEKVKPQTYYTLVKQGEIYQKIAKYYKSIELYNKALIKKESLRVKQELGKVYLAQGNPNQAIKIYEEVLKKDSLNLLLKFELAKLYTKEYRKNDAISLLESLIKSDSLNPGYYYELGKIYKNKGALGFMKSGNYFLETYRLDTTHLKSIYELTKFYKQLRFKDSTSLFIDKGLEINSKSINFNQLKVKDLISKKRYVDALFFLEKLEELNFKFLFTYKYYGMTYMKLKDYDMAEKYFKIALKMDWKDAQVLYYLGLINKEKGDLKSAEMNFIMSMMNLKPEIDKQLFELGLIALDRKDLKKACKYFKESYENNSRNHYALFQLALASDDFYKDKKIALKYYKWYVERFSSQDKKMYDYSIRRIRDLTKEFFMEGVQIN